MTPEIHTLECISDGLSETGWLVIDDAVPEALLKALRHRLHTLPDAAFHRAGVGRRHDHGLQPEYRSDRIHWLAQEEPSERAWLHWADHIRQHVNRTLFMGLQSYEAHFAHYAPGQRYGRHVDAFRGQANRALSTVLYLNEDWSDGDGGDLLLYPAPKQAKTHVRLSPRPGRLVVFLSEDLPHEVLPAQRDRYSIAGWFRVRSDNPI